MNQPLTEQTGLKILDEIGSLKTEIAVLNAQYEQTHRRLFGNGQPGDLQVLRNDVDELMLKRATDAGRDAENKRWSGYIGAAMGAAVSAAFEWVTHKLMK